MATIIVRHRVANFEQWKSVFDSMQKTRLEHGWAGYSVHRDAADPNIVVVVSRVMNIEGAKRYGGSEALRSAMARAGVQGQPEIQFLEDVI
jgi:quinol monooxygenase YgiN